MEENIQIAFNIIAVSLIVLVGLVISFRTKLAKAVGINLKKETAGILGETIGAGVVLAFIIFAVFAVGHWGG
ncbi:MAG: hypothetical protein KAQ63_02805 [Candidatus Moranbacteria bacterium]|nr:hypothetical protein [Candidatus Moranbacteria bacterium]